MAFTYWRVRVNSQALHSTTEYRAFKLLLSMPTIRLGVCNNVAVDFLRYRFLIVELIFLAEVLP